MFEYKPDSEETLHRYEAWWACEVVGRALTSISFPKPATERRALPDRNFANLKARWWDVEFQAELACARLANTVHYADSLPIAYPNLGPEVFSAFYGCDLIFGESTSWSEPILPDWRPESVASITLDMDNPYLMKILEITDALIERGRGKFNVGYTDLHPGGDAIAAFRDPEMLCIDMIEHPGEIQKLCDRITDDFLKIYDVFYDKLSAEGMFSTTWLKATCKGKFHVPSNDFSCMISDHMFEEVFLPGLVRECQHMARNVYHLDGPQALRYLDLLLEIPEIHAVQWVPGAGQSHWRNWIHVYQKIQAAGKAFIVNGVLPSELDELFVHLSPEGAWLQMAGIATLQEADSAIKKIASWT